MKYSVAAIFICLSLLSCKKDDDAGENKSELITSAAWKYDTGGIGDASGNIVFDFVTAGVIPSCALDNTVKFEMGGAGTSYENADICPSSPATSTFGWSLLNNETVLNITGTATTGLSGQFTIKTLTTSKMTLLKDTTITGF